MSQGSGGASHFEIILDSIARLCSCLQKHTAAVLNCEAQLCLGSDLLQHGGGLYTDVAVYIAPADYVTMWSCDSHVTDQHWDPPL